MDCTDDAGDELGRSGRPPHRPGISATNHQGCLHASWPAKPGKWPPPDLSPGRAQVSPERVRAPLQRPVAAGHACLTATPHPPHPIPRRAARTAPLQICTPRSQELRQAGRRGHRRSRPPVPRACTPQLPGRQNRTRRSAPPDHRDVRPPPPRRAPPSTFGGEGACRHRGGGPRQQRRRVAREGGGLAAAS
jgi:hypothetical protein